MCQVSLSRLEVVHFLQYNLDEIIRYLRFMWSANVHSAIIL